MAPPQWAYQIENFVNEPDEEFVCSVCRAIFCDPVECPCNHVFCRACIRAWLQNNRKCPICRGRASNSSIKPVTPLFKNLIMKFVLYCRNKTLGCKAQFPLEFCDGHMKECDYEFVQCKNNNCEERLFRKDISEHEINDCPHRYIDSPKCFSNMPTSVLPENHNCNKALQIRLRKSDVDLFYDDTEARSETSCPTAKKPAECNLSPYSSPSSDDRNPGRNQENSDSSYMEASLSSASLGSDISDSSSNTNDITAKSDSTSDSSSNTNDITAESDSTSDSSSNTYNTTAESDGTPDSSSNNTTTDSDSTPDSSSNDTTIESDSTPDSSSNDTTTESDSTPHSSSNDTTTESDSSNDDLCVEISSGSGHSEPD